VLRGPRDGETVLALHNLGGELAEVGKELLPADGAEDLLSGRCVARAEALELSPYEVLWLRSPVSREPPVS
jgi:hypothetical protein